MLGIAMVVVLLAAFVAGTGGPLPTDTRPAAAQEPVQLTEDEIWAIEVGNRLCIQDIECKVAGEPGERTVDTYIQALLACLDYAAVVDVSDARTRMACESYARDRKSFSAADVPAEAGATASGEAEAFRIAGVSGALVDQFVTDLIRCLERAIWYAGADSSRPRRICAAEYAAIDAAWADIAVSAFTTDLLNDGANAADALRADELMRACLGRLRAQGRSLENAAAECRTETRVALGQRESNVVPPAVTAISCAGSVAAGAPVLCSAEVMGTVTERQWSAPGGSPSGGTGESFTTTYGTDGTKAVELTACNVALNDDRTERARACAVAMTTVTVAPTSPAIDAISCGPATVAPGAVVSCSATVSGATSATTRGWSAPGGDPASGRGPSFSVTFAQPGRRTITFTACNGSACVEQRSSVEVRAAATPTATPAARCQQWDISGTWQTNQGTYNPTFGFQVSGTQVSGTATLPAHEQSRAGYTSPTGTVSGTLMGDRLDVVVTWSGRMGPVRGRYYGTVAEGRIVNGRAVAVGAPESSGVSWTGSGPMRCVRQA